MQFGRLIDLDDIFRTVKFLAIDNSGVTGQSICVDLGFTSIRKYC
jgi:NAD(P)-dependent dehydrogenase (short-subunit alcohol dehydrogenase family)